MFMICHIIVRLRAICGLAPGFFANNAFATTATDSLSINANISASCTIDASSTLSFGGYDPIVTNKSVKLDGTGSTATVSGSGTSENHCVYGLILALQNKNVGSYNDTITVTVTF
jgi:spore coat protein U-like protein